jgi:hypothetical protein
MTTLSIVLGVSVEDLPAILVTSRF